MKLYSYKYAIAAVPAEDKREAAERYYNDTPGNEVDPKNFVELIPHKDFIKIFRLARTLNYIDPHTPAGRIFLAEEGEDIVQAYAKHLGYNISKSDLWHGILKWAERFMEVDDEDIEEWLN